MESIARVSATAAAAKPFAKVPMARHATRERQQYTNRIVEHVTTIHDALKTQRDLSPHNQKINILLTDLVRFVTRPHDREASRNALVRLDERGITAGLRELCQRAEFQMELFYSALDRVFDFPYIDHYLKLARVESRLARLRGSESVAFIGGGPLPWTSIALTVNRAAADQRRFTEVHACLTTTGVNRKQRLATMMHRQHWGDWQSPFKVFSVEKESLVAARSRKVVRMLGFDESVEVLTGDGADIHLPSGCNVFFVASMVDDKESVVRNLVSQIQPGAQATLLVRGVERDNLRSLLYEPVDVALSSLATRLPGLEYSQTFYPEADSCLINAVHVYKYKSPLQLRHALSEARFPAIAIESHRRAWC